MSYIFVTHDLLTITYICDSVIFFKDGKIEEKIDNIDDLEELKDYKTLLQELFQSKFHIIPNYEILSEKGPDHNKKFEIAVKLKEEIVGIGTGTSKKEAEKNAAREAYFLFKK